MRDNFLKHELIGLNVKVISAKNKYLVGINGKIIDESKNILTVACGNIIKKIIKSQVKLQIKFKNKIIEVDGKLLVGRPDDRIKKIRKVK